ncbi:MAG: DNA methyltransferase [Chloroflexi bacterium]|nr:DNA methyltransferase [Chloroflexota bacterium]
MSEQGYDKFGIPNWENRTLFHCDNLDVLRNMNSNSVHLIATDPPFKKGRDFHATPDSLAAGAGFKDRWRWDEDAHPEWRDSIFDDWPESWEVIEMARSSYGDDMGAYLCWLGVRLMEMRRVLRDDGSIYLHIDHTAHAYVKCLMDSIFGYKNFRNEIAWCYRGGGTPKMAFARKHDTILFYTKSEQDNYVFNKQYMPYSEASTKLVESRGGISIDGKERDLERGASMTDWWSDINSLQTWSPERTGYPAQKPLALYRRIIEASSNPNDIVLDPFCGCATTPIAAEKLGRQWVGIDIWDKAYETVLERLREEQLAVPVEDKSENPYLITLGDVHYETQPPERTDDNEIAAPRLDLKITRPLAPWQKLSRKEMATLLEVAQKNGDGVICGGCGRTLEQEFMQLDHITPKSDRGENHILNRILLCGPCNQRKRNNLTLSGLIRENRKVGWMKDETLAEFAQQDAHKKALEVRDSYL